MLPIISIGPLSLPTPQLVLLLGLWLGSSLAERMAKHDGKNAEILSKVIWTAVFAGILGARLSFITRNLAAFHGQWLSVFSLNQSLFDPSAGLLIAITAGYIVAARHQQANLSLLDALVPFIGVLLPARYLSNIASGSGYGTLTNLPWGIYLWGGERHPVQLYYLAASLVVISLVLFRNRRRYQEPGTSFLLFIVYTSGYLTFLSAFQDPAGNLIAGFRIFQLLSWVVFCFTFFLFIKSILIEAENEIS